MAFAARHDARLLRCVAGLVGAFLLSGLLESLLYAIPGTDPATFGSVAFLITLVSLFGCYLPARRAARLDPLVALRHE